MKRSATEFVIERFQFTNTRGKRELKMISLKVRDGESPSPARESRALPGTDASGAWSALETKAPQPVSKQRDINSGDPFDFAQGRL